LRGRDEQLSLLRGQLLGAVEGRGATLFVEGRPGFGKTRLLYEAAELARGLGIRVGTGAMVASDQRIPLAALLAALFEGDEPLLDTSVRSTLHYLPEQSYWLMDELESLLEQAALRSPMLLCLDDMQWAEDGCHVALRNLPARLATLPIVWLVAYRAGRESRKLRTTVDPLVRNGARRSVLGPLDAAAIEQVVTDMVQARPEEGLLRLAERAHGSPFLLVELVRGLQEEALVSIEAGRASLVEERLPARVRDGMQQRLARLSDASGRVAGVASVLGRTFTFDQLAGMLDMAPATLLGPVKELLHAELLRPDEDSLTFRHDLLREAVRDSLPASAQRALQRQAVTVLMATGASPTEVADRLAASAAPGDQGAVSTLRDAARSLGGSDPSTAANLSQRALELTTAGDPAHGPIAAETAMLLLAAGRVSEGTVLADALLDKTMGPEQDAQVRLGIARMVGLSPDVRADAGRRALALPGLPAPLRARHVASLLHNLLVAGRMAEALELAPGAREVVRGSADPDAAFALKLADSELGYVAGDLQRALAAIDSAVSSSPGVNQAVHPGVARELRTQVLAGLDRYDEALAQTLAGLAAAQREHQGWMLRTWEACRGRQLLQLGRLAEAAAALEGVVETSRDAPVGVVEAPVVGALGRIAIHTADAALLRSCARIMRGVDDSSPPTVRGHAALLLGLQAMAAGDPLAARAQLRVLGNDAERAVVPTFPMDVTDEVSVVRIAVASDDGELCRSALASSASRAMRNPAVPSILGAAAHARGLATGRLDDLVEAVRWFERGPRPIALASALEDAGRTAVRLGEPDQGVAMLGRALEIYAQTGASWDARRVRGRLRASGVRRRLPSTLRPTAGWGALTSAELEVVRRVAQGMSNREVAEQLFLSTHTVSTHLRHTYTKLSINSRVELARYVARHDPEPSAAR
jgi:DNA-binding CsgD family transcriptional regulator